MGDLATLCADAGISGLPVLSLWQPFCSLIPRRIKRHETRGFRLPDRLIGQRVVMHATATFPPLRLISEEMHELCIDTFGCGYNFSLPQGCLESIATFGAPIRTEAATPASEEDRIAGDWSPGRWAWPILDVMTLHPTIPAKGKQGWWRLPSAPQQPAHAETLREEG